MDDTVVKSAVRGYDDHAQLESWTVALKAMPSPAVLIDRDGIVLAANRWADMEQGERCFRPESERLGSRTEVGTHGGQWTLAPLDDAGDVQLAAREPEESSDRLMQQFFASGESLLFAVSDSQGFVVESNRAWQRMLGYLRDEVLGVEMRSFLAGGQDELLSDAEATLRRHGRIEVVLKMTTKWGEDRHVRWALRLDMSVGKCFGIGRDITDEGRAAAQLEYRAFHDDLTGLANRARLIERLDEVLAGGASPSVLFCDLDKFKVVNDSLGHRAGDVLLADLALRLSTVTLDDDVLLARIGGDEFVVLIEDGGERRACATATLLLESLDDPFEAVGRPIHLSMSIGIASADTSTERTAAALLGDADTATYTAKARGRNRWVVFDAGLRAAAARRFELEVDLRQALTDGHVEVHYQPIVEVRSGRIVGAEALLRWRDGERLVMPGDFLDVAEDAGLMARLGALVLDETIAIAQRFATARLPMLLSINASDQELGSPDFCRRLSERVTDAGLDPDSFLVEITESAVLATDCALPMLTMLRDAGFHLGLDDFGTGYSSLAHLRELPIDVVKVDRSFVAGLVDDPVTRAVTSSLVDLCGALGLRVVAEGVETAEQLEAVERVGATIAQGFLLHRPMPGRELEELVRAESAAYSSTRV